MAKAVYINAWQYNTRSPLLTELLIQFGYPAPRKGEPVDELLSKIREWLDKNQGVAVAIDEFDQLDEKTKIIYDLQVVNEEANSSLGVVMASNQPPERVQLDPHSQSRLNCQTLQFNSYNAPQLEEILRKRVEQVFKPGTVPDKVIEEITEQVAENSGDRRKGLETLLRQEERQIKRDVQRFLWMNSETAMRRASFRMIRRSTGEALISRFPHLGVVACQFYDGPSSASLPG